MAEHTITIDEIPRPIGGLWYQAACSCGAWISVRSSVYASAWSAGERHRRREEEASINAVAALQDILSAVDGERS